MFSEDDLSAHPATLRSAHPLLAELYSTPAVRRLLRPRVLKVPAEANTRSLSHGRCLQCQPRRTRDHSLMVGPYSASRGEHEITVSW